METQEEKLVPELRFPGFSGEWEEKKFKNVVKFIKNYSYSRNNEGEGRYFHIHYGDIHSTYNGLITKDTVIPKIKINKEHIELENGDIIIADASEDYKDLGKTVVLLDKGSRNIIAGLHTFALRPNKKLNSIYFLNYSYSDRYKKYMYIMGTGVSVFGINKKNLEDMNILLPSLPEQEKIGDFFYKIDKKLELQQQNIDSLKEYKKGMVQRIFSQEIRFKDDNGNDYPDWEEKKLNELFKINAGGDIDRNKVSKLKIGTMNIPIYANSLVNDGLYGYTEEWKVEEESITVTGRGTIGYAIARHEKYYPIVRLLVLRPIIDCNIDFFAEAINKIIIYDEASGVPQLTSPQLGKYKIRFPIKEEQTKIANFLSSIDKKIELEEEKLEEYKNLKKGLMQRMFI